MGVSFFKKTNLFLGVIILLAILLRFWRLGDVPVGFHRDEAFLGYNAYSILKTGRDISGNFLPFHLASFLYSPSGYSYFSIPFIAMFDLNAFSVRFASALFGSLTILLVYFLTKELFVKKSNSLLAAGLLAISPWHINLSRTATENIIVTFFISLGVLLYVISLRRKNNFFLLLSFLSFGITIFLYQAPRAFLPLFIPLLIFIFRQEGKGKSMLRKVGIFLLVILLPLLLILSSSNLSLRIRTVSVFATLESQLALDEQIRGDGVSNINRFISRLFHNKVVAYSSQVMENYFSHFSYNFIFTDKGFPDRYRVPHMGILYIFELPLLLFGIWYLLRYEKKIGFFLIGWVLLSPIGSSLTFDDVPNLQRTLIVLPALSMIEAFGIIYLRRPKYYYIAILAVAIVTYNMLFYLHQYYVHGTRYRPWYRQDGYKELVSKVNALLPDYKKAVVTNYESAPTIFFLFFGRYDPSLFQKDAKDTTMRDFDRISFGSYEFSEEQCPLREKKSGEKGILYVNSGLCSVPVNAVELANIKRGDDSLVFRILTLK